MSLLDKEAPEWELSKENVQPLKEGRDPSTLNSVLQAHQQPDKEARRERIRQKYERAISQWDEDDDPIGIWQEYCRWILDEYPEGDSWRSQLHPVIERMMEKFKDDARYRDDSRYIRMWIRYADLMPNTQEVFMYMVAKNIGQKASLFYEARASVYELARNYPLAEETYMKGIRVEAVPLDRLKSRFKDFQNRMKARAERAKRLAKEKEKTKMEDTALGLGKGRALGSNATYVRGSSRRGGRRDNDENERPTLGGLSVRQASRSRRPVGPQVRSSGGLSSLSTRKTPKPFAPKENASVDAFDICEDNPEDVKMLSPGSKKFPKLPKRSDMIKENDTGGIQKWAGTKLKAHEIRNTGRRQTSSEDVEIFEETEDRANDDNGNEDIRSGKHSQKDSGPPTPTMNTRQAEADVEAMFDTTLGLDPPVTRTASPAPQVAQSSGSMDSEVTGALSLEQQKWIENLPSYYRLYCDVDMQHDTPNFTSAEGEDLLTIEIEEDLSNSDTQVSIFSVIDSKDASSNPQQFTLKVCPREDGNAREYYHYSLMQQRGVSFDASCMTMATAFYQGSSKTYLLLDKVAKCSLTKLVHVAEGRMLSNTTAMYLMAEVMSVVENLHRADLAHGSICADHFMIRDMEGSENYKDGEDLPLRVMLVNLKYASDLKNDSDANDKKAADWNRIIECLMVMLGRIEAIQGPHEEAWNKIIEHLEVGEGSLARKVALASLETMKDLQQELMDLNIKLFEDANRANFTILR